MIGEKLFNNYLDKLVCKVNGRYYGEDVFDRMIVASIYTYLNKPEKSVSEMFYFSREKTRK